MGSMAKHKTVGVRRGGKGTGVTARGKEARGGITIKVSASLYTAAKAGAERTHRSIPKQVEYWTEMGRVLDEVGVSKDDLVQAANAMRGRLRNAPSRASELFQDLVRLFETPPRGAEAEFAAFSEAGKGPVYGTSAQFPGKIVQRLPDGTVLVGSFQNGHFVPEQVVEAEAPQPQYARAGR